MTSKSASILAAPEPHAHIVFPCEDDDLIVQAAALFAAGGLANRESVVTIATLVHGDAIECHLEADGFDIVRLKSEGQWIALDAARLLSRLMSDQQPDAGLFRSTVDELITVAKRNSPVRRVRVFAEMVSLLWKANLDATLRLEELWNEAVEEYSIPVLCTYSMAGAHGRPHHDLPESLLAAHSDRIDAVEPRSVTWSSTPQNRTVRGASGPDRS